MRPMGLNESPNPGSETINLRAVPVIFIPIATVRNKVEGQYCRLTSQMNVWVNQLKALGADLAANGLIVFSQSG